MVLAGVISVEPMEGINPGCHVRVPDDRTGRVDDRTSFMMGDRLRGDAVDDAAAALVVVAAAVIAGRLDALDEGHRQVG